MARLKPKQARCRKAFLAALAELRLQLSEINQKLDHLIRTYRRFNFTTDFSNSSHREFHR